MAAQKRKQRKFSAETFFCMFECLLSQNPSNQISQLLILPDHTEDCQKIKKKGGPRDLFLPENDFQNSSTKKFPKKRPNFEGLETNQRHEIQI